MSRGAERKKQGETLNMLRRLYPIAGVMSFSAVILLMWNPSWAYAAAACCLSVLALCGPILAYFVKKYEKQEARYHGPKKKDPFDGIEKSLIEQMKPLITRVRKLFGEKKKD
jgi:hypothetical protein